MTIQGHINHLNSSYSKVTICPTVYTIYKYAIKRKMVFSKNFSGRITQSRIFIEIPKYGQLTTSDLLTAVI